MIACKKLFLYSVTPILACSMLGSSAFASHKKKKKDDSTATTAQTPTTASGTTTKKTTSRSKNSTEETAAGTNPTTAKTERASRRSRKSSKETAAESKPAETNTKQEAAPAITQEHAATAGPSKSARKPVAETHSTASASDIASAKSKGMVWVNTESKVYHKGGKYYGNTKHGQFMSEADAQKAGYRVAKN